MRKRAIAVLLSAAMMACSITGCGGNSGQTADTQATEKQETAKKEEPAAKGEETTAAAEGGEITGKTEFANDKLLNLD